MNDVFYKGYVIEFIPHLNLFRVSEIKHPDSTVAYVDTVEEAREGIDRNEIEEEKKVADDKKAKYNVYVLSADGPSEIIDAVEFDNINVAKEFSKLVEAGEHPDYDEEIEGCKFKTVIKPLYKSEDSKRTCDIDWGVPGGPQPPEYREPKSLVIDYTDAETEVVEVDTGAKENDSRGYQVVAELIGVDKAGNEIAVIDEDLAAKDAKSILQTVFGSIKDARNAISSGAYKNDNWFKNGQYIDENYESREGESNRIEDVFIRFVITPAVDDE